MAVDKAVLEDGTGFVLLESASDILLLESESVISAPNLFTIRPPITWAG